MHSARIKLTLLDEDGKMIASSILNYGGSAIGSGEAGNTLRGELEARNNENWLLQEENIRLRHAHHDERAEMKILCNTIQARDAANRRLEAKNPNLRGLDSNEGEEGRADAGVIQDCASLRVMATNQLMWTAMPHHTACTWDGTSGDSSYGSGSGSGSDSSSNEILTQTATRAIIKQFILDTLNRYLSEDDDSQKQTGRLVISVELEGAAAKAKLNYDGKHDDRR